MSETASEEVKTTSAVTTANADSPKTVKDKQGRDVVLIPQPTDDPEDPLVCCSTQIIESRTF